MAKRQRFVRGTELILIASALWLGVLGAGQALAGGLMLYEISASDVGLASAGWGARGDLVGSYPDVGMFFFAFNFNWKC